MEALLQEIGLLLAVNFGVAIGACRIERRLAAS